MKVFVSSLIQGYEPWRDAVESAVEMLGHEAIRAEDFPASPDSPQSVCLAGVRDSDAVVLILGSKYGHPQASGLSATHEEYREARERVPVLPFIQDGIDPEYKQREYIREVQEWTDGHYTTSFMDADDLKAKVVHVLHNLLLDNATPPLDERAIAQQSRDLVPESLWGSSPLLVVSVSGGPSQQMLRPSELEDPELHDFLRSESLSGTHAVLRLAIGTHLSIERDTVVLRQEDGAFVSLNEAGGIVIAQGARDDDGWNGEIGSLIEETITERISRALEFIGKVLDHVDPQRRLSQVAVTAALLEAGYLPWRTREEQVKSPGTSSLGLGVPARVLVQLTPPVKKRPALVQRACEFAKDLTVLLRREIRP